MLDAITNWFVVAALIWIIYWKWEMYILTRVKWVFVLMLAFASLAVVRIGVALNQEFLSDHSRHLTSLTILLFAIGVPMLVIVMRRAYNTNGRSKNTIDSAATLAKAAAAAQVAREHAIEAADAAEAARLYAKQAQQQADEATIVSRMATKMAGATAQASKEADAKVGEEQ
jgi:hypothetical protein